VTARRLATLPTPDDEPDAGDDALPFWRRKRLDEMTRTEWESLCDGCGKCCLVKLEYLDTGEIEHSSLACRLLDLASCRCSDYPNRQKKVHDCIKLTPHKVAKLKWLPASCGYRLVAEGRDLYWWHPLVSGDPETVHEAGVSVRGRVVREARKLKPEEHIVDWIDDTGRKAPPKRRSVRTRKSASGRETT
jgi:hypothetical protein